MDILDGKKLSQQIKEEIKQAVSLRKVKGQKTLSPAYWSLQAWKKDFKL